MAVVIGGLCPHPPIMVPAVGQGKESVLADTQQAILELGRRIAKIGAKRLIWITPHGPVFGDGIAININPKIKGNLGRFGAPEESFQLETDLQLALAIQTVAQDKGLVVAPLDTKTAAAYGVDIALDHGIMVPLHFLQRMVNIALPVVVIYMGLLPYEDLYCFGMAVQEAVQAQGEKTAVLASGDLSHRLTPDAPAGYHPQGLVFDKQVGQCLEKTAIMELVHLDQNLVEQAGECGLRPIIMMMGALEGYKVQGEVLSYEGPFGVGYMVASLTPGEADPWHTYYPRMKQQREEKAAQRRAQESYLPALARRSLTYYLQEGQEMPAEGEEVPAAFCGQAGVFVSLKKDGHLRGCIGTISPQQTSIIKETIYNAISAGVKDSRFHPVRLEELDELEISVDVLGQPQPVKDIKDLDPVKYGVIVRSGQRSGLLLPHLEGIDDPKEQIAIAKQKAGIGSEEPVEMERFEVVRYT